MTNLGRSKFASYKYYFPPQNNCLHNVCQYHFKICSNFCIFFFFAWLPLYFTFVFYKVAFHLFFINSFASRSITLITCFFHNGVLVRVLHIITLSYFSISIRLNRNRLWSLDISLKITRSISGSLHLLICVRLVCVRLSLLTLIRERMLDYGFVLKNKCTIGNGNNNLQRIQLE